MKPKLCLYTDSLEPSGVGEHMLALAAELFRQFRVSFACPASQSGLAFLKRAKALNLKTLALEVRGESVNHESLGDWLRADGADIFHCHAGIAWEGHDGIYKAQVARVPFIVRTEHLPYLITDSRQQANYQNILRAVDKLICVSDGARCSFQKAGVPTGKLEIVRNGIVPHRVCADRQTIRVQLNLPLDARIVLTAGRLTEQKGHRFLLEAVPSVIERAPETHFVLVGDGQLKGELQARVRQLGLQSRVHFAGCRSDLPELMSAADLFVLPSLFEGLPLVILEAMAAGLPVIGTRVCGISEAVIDEITGRLVEAGDARALAAAVSEALEQPDLAARWGKAGQKRFEREFTAARMARETFAVYEGLLQQRGAASYEFGERSFAVVKMG